MPTNSIGFPFSSFLNDIMVSAMGVKPRRFNKLYEGVLRGIPHNCLIIVVSNSKREPIDRYEIENDVLQLHSERTDHEAVIAHQKDPIIAEAFKKSGYKSFLDADGIIRNGKAEGMIIGIMLAKLFLIFILPLHILIL